MLLSKTDCMAMERKFSTCQIDQIFIDTHLTVLLLIYYNSFVIPSL